ncbi:L,D-transpeptidase family protein [Swingsia samuiensis]|uniref:L,D-TPase catalytic domain-containing protein n=1 Tax=Swingsia samuiensis TaxID=1293412 RepID=A0A4Y6UN49_9PROT|nr:L,D-transpeptidase family protein [Swingsia samuiensis]QDH17811.1 hypothetical protein E3D00_09705 [Swingsia samuiensis]
MKKAILKIEDSQAFLYFNQQKFTALIGKNGLNQDKTEGDYTTPVGILPLQKIFYRADRLNKPITPLNIPIQPISLKDGWCDDPTHIHYNQHVNLPHEGSHEQLWREDHTYDICIVLGWNDAPPIPGRGSAIFLHLPPASGFTEGCIALNEKDLRQCLSEGLDTIEVEAN